jgi:hypothetical protein
VSDLEAARAAKARLAAALQGNPQVTGVGLARAGGDVVLKVLLVEDAQDIPGEQDGVPVVTEVVGRIARRSFR